MADCIPKEILENAGEIKSREMCTWLSEKLHTFYHLVPYYAAAGSTLNSPPYKVQFLLQHS